MCPITSSDAPCNPAFRPWWTPRLWTLAPLGLLYGAVSAGPLAFAVVFPTLVIVDWMRGGPVLSMRSPLVMIVWLALWAASVAAAVMYFQWIGNFWRAERSSGLDSHEGEEKRLTQPLLFFGRMQGPGTYRFENSAVVLCARVLPGSTMMVMLYGGLAILGGMRGAAIPLSDDWLVIALFVLFVLQTGLFSSTEELRLEKSNIERVEVDGARVALRFRGLFQKQVETIEFVVSRGECPRFFSRFEQAFPGLLPGVYAETARRVEAFREAIGLSVCR